MKWSVGIEAEGDQVLTREQVVELADAVVPAAGIATGIGTNRYGAQLVVEAGGRDEAVELATREFTRAAAQAGLPPAPIVRVEAVSEADDEPAGLTEGTDLAGDDEAAGPGDAAGLAEPGGQAVDTAP